MVGYLTALHALLQPCQKTDSPSYITFMWPHYAAINQPDQVIVHSLVHLVQWPMACKTAPRTSCPEEPSSYYKTSFWNSCIQRTRNVCWTVALSLSSSPVQSVPRNSEGRWNASACLSWGQISSSARPQHVRNSFCFLTQLSSEDGIFIRWFVGTVTVLNDIFYSYFDCTTVYISDFQTYMKWSKFTI